MALGLEQRGTGRALVIFSGPCAPGDTTTAPGLPAASKAALGPTPWIVSVNAHGTEGLQQILGFARVNRADLWLAAVVAFSAGGQKLRQLRQEGLKLGEPGALAWVSIDAMHSQKPPLAPHVQAARDLAAQARAGALTFVLTHTYIQPQRFTSTADMARLATGWPLAMPPLGQTVVRSEGGLSVYSTGSTPDDTRAHIWQARVLMPYVLGRHVRSLVELDARPDLGHAPDPSASSSPEPAPVVTDTGSPSVATSTPGTEPNRVLFVGDSLAVGLARPLVDLCAKLQVLFASQGQQSSTIHQWLTGAGAGLMKPLATLLDQAKPTLTLVCLGTNDMRTADPAAAGRLGGQLVDLLRQRGAGTVGWILPPTMPFGDRGFRSALLAELAQRHVRSFDSTKLTLTRAGDQIHPDGNSYAAWARAIAGWWPLSLLAPGALPTPSATSAPALASAFFTLAPGESIRDRIVRCCHEALDSGPMGENNRHVDYKSFIAAGEEPDGASAEALTHVRTSCALFVRAIHLWCGAPPKGHYQPGTPMFDSIGVDGPVTFGSPSFVAVGTAEPCPGDAFFMADPDDMNNAHTGIFLNQAGDGSWTTAEGGGGDGTLCRLRSRTISGDHFADDALRKLWGWFDCTKIGLPESPASGDTPAPTGDVWVAGIGRMPFDPDYVARVVTAENGRARGLEGLKALAIAARTYARDAMNRTPGLGTEANPLKNGTTFQVCAAGAPAPLCARAAEETRGGLALYRGKLISANHVAGAPWPAGQKHGVGPGLGNTERFVTYNEFLRGADVHPSPIGFMKAPQNRGCLAQVGADALATAWGYTFGDIVRFFYGGDTDLTVAEPIASRAPERPPAPRPPVVPAARREPPPTPAPVGPAPRAPARPQSLLSEAALFAAGALALARAVAGAVV
jgi:lysophospholipase L1-like esterase